MDQFPEHIIENIFSYYVGPLNCNYSFMLRFELDKIFNLRLVCRKFLNLELYLVNNLILDDCWSRKVYQLYRGNHPFWKKYLPYVRD